MRGALTWKGDVSGQSLVLGVTWGVLAWVFLQLFVGIDTYILPLHVL